MTTFQLMQTGGLNAKPSQPLLLFLFAFDLESMTDEPKKGEVLFAFLFAVLWPFPERQHQ